jgi:DNA-directed RNA polymerase specialized sigma24 family protein
VNDEHALIARAVGGERLALDQLASTHRPAVLRIARHILGDPAQAEDATQDVFVRLQVALPGF